MIRFLLYAPRIDFFAPEIAHIRSLVLSLGSKLFIIDNRSKLICLLPRFEHHLIVPILFASTSQEFEDFVNIQELFRSIPIILVLTDDMTDTVKVAIATQSYYFVTKQDSLIHLSLAIDELVQIYVHDNAHHVNSNLQFESPTRMIA